MSNQCKQLPLHWAVHLDNSTTDSSASFFLMWTRMLFENKISSLPYDDSWKWKLKMLQRFTRILFSFVQIFTCLHLQKNPQKHTKKSNIDNSQSKVSPSSNSWRAFCFIFPLNIYLLHCRLYFHLAQIPY